MHRQHRNSHHAAEGRHLRCIGKLQSHFVHGRQRPQRKIQPQEALKILLNESSISYPTPLKKIYSSDFSLSSLFCSGTRQITFITLTLCPSMSCTMKS